MNEHEFFKKYNDIILLSAVLLSYLFTLIPLVITAIQMHIIYTLYDSLLAWALIIFSTGAFIVAYIAVIKRTSTIYQFLYFGFNLLLAAVFTFFVQIWAFVLLIEILGMIAAVKATNLHRNFFPRFKSRRPLILAGFSLIIIAVPVLVYFAPPPMNFTIEVIPEFKDKPLEINFALVNNTELPEDLLDILKRCNDLEKINISVEIPILEEMILNPTVFIGESMPNRSTYIKPRVNYTEWSDYDNDLKEFQRAWDIFTKKIEYKVGNMTYEELMMLNASNFDTSGLLVSQTRRFHAAGIAVDYMPLLEQEVYVNDNSIYRINSTLTLFKRWIEINNLETAHRGLVFDTEVDWKIRFGMLLRYGDYETHAKGLEALGKMVSMTKLWEWKWKNLDQIIGPYSVENWKNYAIGKRTTYVGSATFGMHIDDLWDLDDAQQNALKMSITTERDDTQFDFIGIMTYETGENSEQAVYSYCLGGDYFFGEANVPYIYSGMNDMAEFIDNPENYLDAIIRKFRIIQNYGYEATGIWGLTHLYCFSDWQTGWCGGLYDFLKAFWTPEAIFWMCNNLTTPEPVSFSVKGFNFAYAHPAMTLLDAYLISPIRYGDWPINENIRIQPDRFIDYPYVTNYIIMIGLGSGVIILGGYGKKRFSTNFARSR